MNRDYSDLANNHLKETLKNSNIDHLLKVGKISKADYYKISGEFYKLISEIYEYPKDLENPIKQKGS